MQLSELHRAAMQLSMECALDTGYHERSGHPGMRGEIESVLHEMAHAALIARHRLSSRQIEAAIESMPDLEADANELRAIRVSMATIARLCPSFVVDGMFIGMKFRGLVPTREQLIAPLDAVEFDAIASLVRAFETSPVPA